jgi:hypothetical protein
MKLYQEIESLLKFRISSNEGVVSYMLKMSRLGKLDEPKKIALLTIILDRLGRMEDEEGIRDEVLRSIIREEIAKQVSGARRVDDEPKVEITGSMGLNTYIPDDFKEIESQTEPVGATTPTFACDVCPKVAKSKIGLISHRRTHEPTKSAK